MALKEAKRQKILEYAFQKFTTVGFSHVTMDEISKGAGIGKGTLYQYFPSKEVLLYKTIDHIKELLQTKINEIMENTELSPLEKLGVFFKMVGSQLASVNPDALDYMERNVPEAFEKIIEFRGHIIMTNLFQIFEEGKEKGLFDPNMDENLAAHMLIGAADHLTNGKVLSTLNYSLDNLFHSVISTLLTGCLTETGRKQMLLFEDPEI